LSTKFKEVQTQLKKFCSKSKFHHPPQIYTWNIGRSCRKAVVGSPNQNAENKDKKIKHEETK
jgi:hypothetical protein